MKTRWLAASTAVLALIAGLLVAFAPVQSASAADGSQFDPGNIISDAQFYDGGAMNGQQVQSFLSSQVSSCRTAYCLSIYRQATPSMPAVSGRCDAYPGSGDQSAAEIIAGVGAACGISQKAILVLLEKEQSLVTSSSPTKGRLDAATGMACPDTAPCDPAFSGFFYQVYYAARQFKAYAASPTSWNYQAGRVNNILFHPNTACGSSPVYIVNKATAGLYNYTPYQPNAAALANLYGTGDGCSSYGNRNFWRLYSDWFGSPTVGTSLVRTVDNATVYLVSGDVKYPIASQAVLASYSPLGQVGYVSQSYLDKYTTKQTAGRIFRSSDGTIYFTDAGIRLPFGTCGLVVDYGGSCNSNGYIQLTDAQTATFFGGPAMGPIMGTTAGGRYYVTLGTKREILDTTSQQQAGLPLGYNVLTENALADFGTGSPIARDGVYLSDRDNGASYVLAGGAKSSMTASVASAVGASSRLAGTLRSASIARLPGSGQFTGLTSVSGTVSALSNDGRWEFAKGTPFASVSGLAVPAGFLDSYSKLGSIGVGSAVKHPDNGTVFVVDSTTLRPVTSWEALLTLTAPASPVIATLPTALVTGAPVGSPLLRVGSLVRTPQDATVYFIDGLSTKVPMTSFGPTSALGFSSLSYVSDQQLVGYTTLTKLLSFAVTCGSTNYIAAGGSIHALSSTTGPLYPLPSTPLTEATCRNLTTGSPATTFIRTSDGSIYKLSGGKKLPIASMARFGELGGPTEGYLDVDSGLASQIPTGPLA